MSGIELKYDGSVVIDYPEVPGSVNHGKNRRGVHWSITRDEKKRWEGIYQMLLMAAKLPRRLSFVTVNVELKFIDEWVRRDAENYRAPIVKPFADALTLGGWLVDDQQEFFVCERLLISRERLEVTKAQKLMGVRSHMWITLDYLLGPDSRAPFSAGGTSAGSEASEGGGESPLRGDDSAHGRPADQQGSERGDGS